MADRAAREELVERHGRLATPTLVVGEKLFLGFKQNREEIERIIDDIAGSKND